MYKKYDKFLKILILIISNNLDLMSLHKVLYLCVNAHGYKSTIKLQDNKFRKTDNFWNQLFQIMIIVEMRLKRFMQDGQKKYCKNTKVSAKADGQVFKSVVR